MIKPKEILSITPVENDSHFDAVPRRHSERRQTTSSDSLKSENSLDERRVEDRRKSRPTAFLSAEELVNLRKP